MDTHVKERKMSQRRVRTEVGPTVNPDGVADTMVRGNCNVAVTLAPFDDI